MYECAEKIMKEMFIVEEQNRWVKIIWKIPIAILTL
jgi:hypothetical protein